MRLDEKYDNCKLKQIDLHSESEDETIAQAFRFTESLKAVLQEDDKTLALKDTWAALMSHRMGCSI